MLPNKSSQLTRVLGDTSRGQIPEPKHITSLLNRGSKLLKTDHLGLLRRDMPVTTSSRSKGAFESFSKVSVWQPSLTTRESETVALHPSIESLDQVPAPLLPDLSTASTVNPESDNDTLPTYTRSIWATDSSDSLALMLNGNYRPSTRKRLYPDFDHGTKRTILMGYEDQSKLMTHGHASKRRKNHSGSWPAAEDPSDNKPDILKYNYEIPPPQTLKLIPPSLLWPPYEKPYDESERRDKKPRTNFVVLSHTVSEDLSDERKIRRQRLCALQDKRHTPTYTSCTRGQATLLNNILLLLVMWLVRLVIVLIPVDSGELLVSANLARSEKARPGDEDNDGTWFICSDTAIHGPAQDHTAPINDCPGVSLGRKRLSAVEQLDGKVGSGTLMPDDGDIFWGFDPWEKRTEGDYTVG